MGRLEKQIVIGALALVGFLMGVVIYKGLGEDAADDGPAASSSSWNDPGERGVEPGIQTPSHTLSIPPAKADDRARSRSSQRHAGTRMDRASTGGTEARLLLPTSPTQSPGGVEEAAGSPADPAPAWPKKHIVRPGDTLSEIAERYYGRSFLFDEIVAANPGLQANALRLGQELIIPDVAHAEARHEERGSGQAASTKDPARPGIPEWTGRVHVVRAGDSLWKIADEHYDAGHLAHLIVEANDELGSESAVLRIGQKLRIPEPGPREE